MNFANWPAPQPLCLLMLTQLLSSAPEPGSLFFLSSPWQSKLRRISVRKSNKNKA